MDMFFVLAILLIIVLIAIRMIIRRMNGGGQYIEIYQTTSGTFNLPKELREELDEQKIRYRIIRRGSVNQPFSPLYGPQLVALEAHIEDLEKARRVVSKVIQKNWAGRS